MIQRKRIRGPIRCRYLIEFLCSPVWALYCTARPHVACRPCFNASQQGPSPLIGIAKLPMQFRNSLL